MGYITGEHVDCEPVFEIPNFRNDVTRSLTGAGLISPNGTMNIASLTISKFLNRSVNVINLCENFKTCSPTVPQDYGHQLSNPEISISLLYR